MFIQISKSIFRNRIVSFSRIYNKAPTIPETKVILKDLLNLSENYHSVLKHSNGLGIEVENVKLNLKKI